MMNKAYVAACLAFAFSGMALADTPIGPGVTGSGGTGANATDAISRPGAGSQTAKTREDGMAVDHADAKVRAEARAKDSKAAASTGSTSGSAGTGARGTVDTAGGVDGGQRD